MSHVAHIGLSSSLSSLTYVGVAGLTCFGIFKLLKDLWRFRRAEAGKNAELSSLRRSLTSTRSDAENREEALKALQDEFDRMKSRLEELEKLLERTRRHNKILEDQVKQQTEASQLLKDEALQIKTKHAQTLQLLETRTLELKGAETFLTKADALSGADVIGMLNTLNSEIYQTAALVAESFEFKEKKSSRPGWREVEDVNETGDDVEGAGDTVEKGNSAEEMAEVHASAIEILGSRMVELLKTSEHHEDPTLIQIAFQAGMSAYTNWIVTSWYFDDPEEEYLISEIYMRVRDAGK
jgi:DNA repair exonuclease SbcCD ATPase subunit